MPALPLHVVLCLLFLGLSLLLCATVALFGRRPTEQPMFPGSTFPSPGDSIYTAVFIIGFAGAVGLTLAQTPSGSAEKETWATLLTALVFQFILYLPMLVRWFKLPARPHPTPTLPQALGWVGATLALILLPSAALDLLHADQLIMQLTGCPETQNVVQTLQGGGRSEQWLIMGAAVFMAPVCEECCFRGFLYNLLRSRAGVLPSALSVGFLFGCIHTSLVQLIPLTIFGVVQCLAYEKAKSLWLPIAVHATFNALSCVYILLSLD